MYRSILFNCWIALFSFSFYFIKTIYDTGGTAAPMQTMMWSFIWAIFGFILAYGLRAFLDYILYTPEQIDGLDTELIPNVTNGLDNEATSVSTLSVQKNSTVEFQDESSEDIAQVVRTMLHRDEPFVEK